MTSHNKHYLRLSPKTETWLPLNLTEIWDHRELVGFLAWREITSRYRQAALGAAWAVIQPLMTALVFSLIFGRLAKLPSDGTPYPLFSFAALLPWQYYQTASQTVANSLVNNPSLITKVYFPRLVIPLAHVLPALIDLLIALAVFLVLMLLYGVYPTFRLLWIPAFILLAFCTALGVGLWYSALSVEYRDVRHAIPFVTQLWLFASPVAYSSNLIPELWRPVYALNPLVEVIDGFRWASLGTGQPFGPNAAYSILGATLILLSGAFYFRKMERAFADVI